MVTSEPGTISAAAARNAAELGSPGTFTSRPASSPSPLIEMARTPWRLVAVSWAPKWLSMRSVWSRVASGSITVVSPAACRPAISTADLICAEGDGQPILDRDQVGAAADGERQRLPALVEHLQPHLLQRLRAPGPSAAATARHRRSGARACRGRRARPSSAAPRCRHCRSRGRRRARSARPHRGPAPPRSPPPWRSGSPAPATRGRCARMSSPSSRPVMRVRPVASAPNMRARCEIDLSPGTRTRARQGLGPVGGKRRWGCMRHVGWGLGKWAAPALPAGSRGRHRARGGPVNNPLRASGTGDLRDAGICF